MRKIKEVLRLKCVQGLSNRQIAKACGIARPTVGEYLRRAAEAGLAWPLPADLDEATLERQLFPPPTGASTQERSSPALAVIVSVQLCSFHRRWVQLSTSH